MEPVEIKRPEGRLGNFGAVAWIMLMFGVVGLLMLYSCLRDRPWSHLKRLAGRLIRRRGR